MGVGGGGGGARVGASYTWLIFAPVLQERQRLWLPICFSATNSGYTLCLSCREDTSGKHAYVTFAPLNPTFI